MIFIFTYLKLLTQPIAPSRPCWKKERKNKDFFSSHHVFSSLTCFFLFFSKPSKINIRVLTLVCLYCSSKLITLIVEFEIKVARVELMQSDITIFTATGICLTVGVEGQRVNGAKMSFDTTKLFFEYQVEKSSVKLADT